MNIVKNDESRLRRSSSEIKQLIVKKYVPKREAMARRFSVENTFFKNREIHLCRRQIKLRAAGLYFFTDSGGNDFAELF